MIVNPIAQILGIIGNLILYLYLFLWLLNTKFPIIGFISSIFLLISAFLIFYKPDVFGYRTSLFSGKYFDSAFRRSQRHLAITFTIIALLTILSPLFSLKLFISLLTISFFGIGCFVSSLIWLQESFRLKQQGISIASKQILVWFRLLLSLMFVIIGILILLIDHDLKP